MQAPTPTREKSNLGLTILICTLIIFNIVPEGLSFTPDLNELNLPVEGSSFSRFVWIALLFSGAALSISRSAKALSLVKQVNVYFWLFFALIAVSTFWSIDSDITFRRMLRAYTIALDGIALGVVSSQVTKFQSLVRPVLTVMLVLSVLFVMVAPDLAIMQSTQSELIGAWHGLTTQKNAFGSLAGFGFTFWLHAWLSKETSRAWAVFGCVLSAVCLLNSRSSTSIMATAFGAPFMVMLMRPPAGLRRYLPYIIGIFAIVLLTYSLAVLSLIPGSGVLLSPITSLTGKDLTFSGRTAIWQLLNEHIAYAPWLGSGYGAYWVNSPNSPSSIMLQRLYFYPNEGHNGYLDVINDLGAFGVICLAGYLMIFLRQSLRIFRSVRVQGALYLTLFFEQMIGNLTESRWFNALDFDFVIMTLATMAMARTLMDLRQREAPQVSHR